MLRVSVDGSGKSEDISCRFLTLSGIMASDRSSADFEQGWNRVLSTHHVPYSHMQELLRGEGPFEDWDDVRKRGFVIDLFNVLGQMDRQDFFGCSLTIDLEDYRKLAKNRQMVKPAEAVCVDFVMGHVFRHPRFRDGETEIFFDRGESFMKFLDRIWRKNRQNASSWAAYITSLIPVEMERVPAVQAADLFAWSANRLYNSEPEEQNFWRHCLVGTIIAVEHYHSLYKEPDLLRHPGFFNWHSNPGE